MGRAQAHHRRYFSGRDRFKLFAAVGVQAEDAAHAVVALLRHVAQGIAFFDPPGVKAQKGKFAPVLHQHFED